jgi:tRNA1(Val) A37 N6-methylase TrmN6
MSFSEAALTRDAFLGGRLLLAQPRKGYRAGTDAVLLAAFVPARRGERVLELGCGAGAAVLCLLARVPGVTAHGLELQPDYADLARRNAAANALPLEVVAGDLAAMPGPLRAMTFDHVMANPPFHGGGSPSPDPGRTTAHREATPLTVWIDAALRRLRPAGTLTMIHRVGRLGSILASLEGRAGATEVLPLAGREGFPAGRVLVRARKSVKAPLVLYPPFTLHAGRAHDGDRDSYTDLASSVLRDMRPLLPDTRLSGIEG